MTRMMELGRWARWALLAAVAALVVWGLVVLLVQLPSSAAVTSAGEATAEPVDPLAAAPAATEAPVSALPDEPERRFLAMASDGTLYRGTAGSCAAGILPTLESTRDAVTWTSVLPAGATQLLSLAVDPLATITADADCTSVPDAAFTVQELPDRTLATDGDSSAVLADDCGGVVFMTAGFRRCVAGLDPADPVAIDLAADGRLYYWSGDALSAIDVS